MRKRLTIVVIALLLCSLLIASAISIHRAKYLPDQPSEEQTQESETEHETEATEVVYTEYTGQAHQGTGITYRGSGANADKIIVIDAGHQLHAMSETEPDGPGSDTYKAKVTGGTQGALTGLAEYELNLRVALALRDVLVKQGYCVVMVRETNEVEISNAERAQLANKVGAHVNLRIHANGDASTSLKGAVTICQTEQNPYNANIYKECRRLSEIMLQAFCQGTGIGEYRLWETDTMTGINWASVPTTIVEMGFLTNAEDEAIMADEGFAAKAAQALAAGIAQYFAMDETEVPTTTEPETEAPSGDYEINYELEAELGESFTETYMTMETTGNVRMRTEPSTRGGEKTTVLYLTPGQEVTCVGLGKNWNRVLMDGKIYYVSAEYLKEAGE